MPTGYVKNGKIDRRIKTHSGKTWYCTGDRGVRDPDGYFWFVGRDDDVSGPWSARSMTLQERADRDYTR